MVEDTWSETMEKQTSGVGPNRGPVGAIETANTVREAITIAYDPSHQQAPAQETKSEMEAQVL